MRLVGDGKTANKAPRIVPGREEAFLVTVPLFIQATWVLPGTFEEPTPWLLESFLPSPISNLQLPGGAGRVQGGAGGAQICYLFVLEVGCLLIIRWVYI